MSYYTTSQRTAIDKDNRQMGFVGLPMSTELEDIRDLLASSSIGSTAAGGDIDSLALDGGHFSRDPDNDSGLTFAFAAGRLWNGTAIVSVAAGTVLLSSSTTNYVEVSPAGVVSKNTVGFTAGSIPLYQVVTGASTITTVTNKKTLLSTLPSGGWTGANLTVAQRTESIEVNLGTISATTAFTLTCPAYAATVAKVTFVTKDAIAASDTNYFDFGLVNKGAAGAGTTKIVDSTDAANSTKATGGTALAAYVKRALTLHSTPANLDTAAEDVLEFTITKTAAPSNMTQCSLRIDFVIAV
jgi:hypothetical protein